MLPNLGQRAARFRRCDHRLRRAKTTTDHWLQILLPNPIRVFPAVFRCEVAIIPSFLREKITSEKLPRNLSLEGTLPHLGRIITLQKTGGPISGHRAFYQKYNMRMRAYDYISFVLPVGSSSLTAGTTVSDQALRWWIGVTGVSHMKEDGRTIASQVDSKRQEGGKVHK